MIASTFVDIVRCLEFHVRPELVNVVELELVSRACNYGCGPDVKLNLVISGCHPYDANGFHSSRPITVISCSFFDWLK